MAQCSVEGCANSASERKRGYCHRHYSYLRRYGDPLHVSKGLKTKPGEAMATLRELLRSN
jgi:hypothetical protein